MGPEDLKPVAEMVKYDVGTSALKQFIKDRTGKNVKSSDIHNIRANIKKAFLGDRKESEFLIDYLIELKNSFPGVNLHLEIDESHDLAFLLIQTPLMNMYAKQYGDCIFVDGTYNTNLEGYPLYIILCEDGEGKGQPLVYIFVKNETGLLLRSAFTKFVEICPLPNCKTIVTDKDFVEISIFKDLFPSASLLLCIFHVIKYLRTKVNNLDLAKEMKSNIMACLMSLIYSYSKPEYDEKLKFLQSLAPPEFFLYFLANWDSCRESWVYAYRKTCLTLGNNTNNRIESHNQKLKTVIKSYMHLSETVRRLLEYCSGKEVMKVHTTIDQIKMAIDTRTFDDEHMKIAMLCTSEAVSLMNKEHQKGRESSLIIEADDGDEVIIQEGNTEYYVYCSKWVCSCSFYNHYNLPCRHIMECRKQKSLDFDVALVPERWRKTEILKELPRLESTVTTSKMTVLNSQQKYKKADVALKQIGSFLATCGMKEFTSHLQFLEQILQDWQNNKTVTDIQELAKTELDKGVLENVVIPSVSSQETSDATNAILNSVDTPSKGEAEDFNVEPTTSDPLLSMRSQLKIPELKRRRGRPKNSTKPFSVFSGKRKDIGDEPARMKKRAVRARKYQAPNIILNSQMTSSILQNEMLCDNTINKAQFLISKKSNVAGLQDPLFGQTLRFQSIARGTPMVQILHCGDLQHWVTVSTLNAPPDTVFLYDSVDEAIPINIIPQICNIVTPSDRLVVKSIPVQSQGVSVDCGLFAIANALCLASGRDPGRTYFKQSLMRQHLHECFLKEDLEFFPTMVDKSKVIITTARQEVFDIFCCSQPYLDSDIFPKLQDGYKFLQEMVECTGCRRWFHQKCKGFDIKFNSENASWYCSEFCH